MLRQLLLAAMVVCSVAAVAAPTAAQDTATLTVSVVTDDGAGIGGATIEASWDGGETTETTAGNGKAFVDVPAGADVELSVESEDYIRNTPFVVENADDREVEVTVARKGQLTVEATDPDGAVEDVRVRLLRSGTEISEGRTDAQGSYTTDVVEQGSYVVRLYKPGYYRNATRVTVGEDSNVSFGMRKGKVNVQFEAVDDHFSEPQRLSDVQVSVDDLGTQRTTGGTVTFSLPVNSRYSVTATKDGYQVNETSIFVGTAEETVRLAINRERTLTIEPANQRVVVGETVSVRVRDAYGDRVEGATILVDGEEAATTDAEGNAAVPIESDGDHELEAEYEGVTSTSVTVEGVSGDGGTPEPTDSPTASPTPEEGLDVPLPGFGPVAALLALLLVGLVAATRRE
jgi:hypothetical protein